MALFKLSQERLCHEIKLWSFDHTLQKAQKKKGSEEVWSALLMSD